MKDRRSFLRDSSLLIGGLFVSAPIGAFARAQMQGQGTTGTQPPPQGPAGTVGNPQPQGFGNPPGPVNPLAPPPGEHVPPPAPQPNTTPNMGNNNPYDIATQQRYYTTGYYQTGYYTGYYY